MAKENIGWLFYRDYYGDLLIENDNSSNALDLFSTHGQLRSKENSKEKINQFFNKKSEHLISLTFEKPKIELVATEQKVTVTTTYPGLLIGTGYGHGTGTMGEFKLGFFFDHTTGQPIIAGSSVKGVLRSAFPSAFKKIGNEANRIKLIQILLAEIDSQLKNINITQLENHIFGSTDTKGVDIFHDAFIISGGKDNKLFGEDYITPHLDLDTHKPAPLKNPTPVRFLKVLPNVKFQFNFDLNNYTDPSGTVVTKEHKRQLFEKILHLLGIGAKSNVGYGKFAEAQVDSGKKKTENENATPLYRLKKPTNPNKPQMLDAEVTQSGASNFVKVYLDEGNCVENIRLVKYSSPIEVGKIIEVEARFDGKGKIQQNQVNFTKLKS